MGRLKAFIVEWKARRAGAKFVTGDIRRSARDIIGPTGYNWSNAWDLLENDETYLDSFDRRIPPSLHISERDRSRQNIPVPLVERCIEDYKPAARELDVEEDESPAPT